jgi:hypothetical protein
MVLPLKASVGLLSVARSEIEKGSKRPDEVLLIAPDDKRRLHDRRREHILRALFHGGCWPQSHIPHFGATGPAYCVCSPA